MQNKCQTRRMGEEKKAMQIYERPANKQVWKSQETLSITERVWMTIERSAPKKPKEEREGGKNDRYP